MQLLVFHMQTIEAPSSLIVCAAIVPTNETGVHPAGNHVAAAHIGLETHLWKVCPQLIGFECVYQGGKFRLGHYCGLAPAAGSHEWLWLLKGCTHSAANQQPTL